MFEYGIAKGDYFVAVAETLAHMRVVMNVDVSASRARKLAKVHRRLKCSPPEAALSIGCAAANSRLKAGDFEGAEELAEFIETECDSLKTLVAFAAREQIKQIRTELRGTQMLGINRSRR